MTGRLLRVAEAAAFLNITIPTVYRWIGADRLRVVRFGRNLRITEEEIQDFLRRESHYKDLDGPVGGDAA